MKLSDPRSDLSRAIVLPWAAVSTKIQDKYSIEDQLKLEREWCARHGATMLEPLVVRGFSRDYWTLADVVAAAAHDKDMQAFAQLQAHIRQRDFNIFLCFDADRFGRTQSLIHEVLGRITRDCSALIYTLFDNTWMDEENAPLIGTLKAYKAQEGVTKLKGYRVTGMDNRARDGKSTSAILPIFHLRLRDEKGKETAVIVNEDLRPLWTDLATLILRGVAWQRMEVELFTEFGHGRNGAPYPWNFMRSLVYHFAFWGHAALNFRWKGESSTNTVAPWIWDETVPAPEPITVYRNRLPAVYSGEWAELGEQVKAELWRRYQLRGKATSENTFRFHGFLVCDECGFTLVKNVNSTNKSIIYMRCATRFGSKVTRSATCTQHRHLRSEIIQAYFHNQLELRLSKLPSELFDELNDTDYLQRRINDNERLVARLQKRAETTVAELVDAPDNLRAIYRRQLAEISAELERTTSNLEQLQGDFLSKRDAVEAQKRAESLLEQKGVAWLWDQPDTVIHQTLSAALGQNQLVVRDGAIIGVAPTRSRLIRKKRKSN